MSKEMTAARLIVASRLANSPLSPIPEDSRDVLGDISARRVLYASSTLDITQMLIDYMNTQWRAAHGN